MSKTIKKKKSSYQLRLEDLEFAWEQLSEIKEILIGRMDGATDEECLKELEDLVLTELFMLNKEEMHECPLCGMFAKHSHPEL